MPEPTHDVADAKKARDAWMATDAFTEFRLENFREAARRAVADQAARGLTSPT